MKTLAKLDLRGSVDIFRKGLEDSDEIIRISALEYIGLANDNASTDLVISLLEKSGGAIRDMCADILIKIGGYAALDPLYKVIKQVDRELLDLASKSRRVILEQRKMGLDLKTAIEAGDDQSLYLSALNAGQETGEMDFGSIIKAIDSESIFVASSAIISFAKKCSPEKGIVKLSQKIDHKSAYVRESTATALGMIGTYDAVELLEKLYRDKSSEVRFAAARSLGKILSSESRRILMKMMDDKDVHVRNAAKKSYNNICGIAGDKKMIFMGSGLTRQPA
jgi:HEAT repeat protein